jgi:drug/metabolite transporter (DMT)-like permease
MVFETLGISMTSSTTTGVILSLIPISSVVCESLVLKEKTTVMQKLFLLVGVIGVAYIAIKTGSNEGTDSFIGITFLVLAVFCGSLFQVFSRKSSRSFNAMEVTYFSCMLGAIAFNAANIVRHIFVGDILNYFKPYFNGGNLVGFVFLAIISTVIATCMGNYSLGKMQATTMAALSEISTLTTITVGVVFGNEFLYYYHYIGITLIIIRMIGVSSIAIKKDRYGKTQELTGNV